MGFIREIILPVIPTEGGRLIDYPEGMLRVWSPQERPEPLAEHICVGLAAWVERRRWESGRFTPNPHKMGQARDLSAAESDRIWRKSRKQAEKEVSEIKEKLNLEDAAAEALTEAVTVLRGPISAKDKIAAARLVLDFTMAKPVAKSEVTVNKAEEWLASLTE